MREHRLRDCLCRAYQLGFDRESLGKFLRKALEQLLMLSFFLGEGEQRAHAVLVAVNFVLRPFQGKRKDELLDQTKQVQVRSTADLVEEQLLSSVQSLDVRDAGKRIWQEGFAEV